MGQGWRDGAAVWRDWRGVERWLWEREKPARISWGLGVRWVPSEEVSGPGLPGWLGN